MGEENRPYSGQQHQARFGLNPALSVLYYFNKKERKTHCVSSSVYDISSYRIIHRDTRVVLRSHLPFTIPTGDEGTIGYSVFQKYPVHAVTSLLN